MKKSLTVDFRMHNSSGIGTYIKNIIPYLTDVFDIILIGKKNELEKYYWCNNLKIIESTSKIYSLEEQKELYFKIPESDYFWSPHYNIPLLPIKSKKRIVTIHDIFHLVNWHNLSLSQKIYSKFIISQAIKKSDIIFTVSQFSANEIKKYIKTEKKIYITYNAIDNNKFRILDNSEYLNNIKNKYNLPDNFILYVGNVKPHKNLKNLIIANKNLKKHIVIVGKREGFVTNDNNIIQIIKETNLEDYVVFTGYVNDDDLPAFYNLAAIFVFPSLYEGFGIPPMEAQASGCPVACSNIESLKEVYGESVEYFNPLNTEELEHTIAKLFDDTNLRKKLIEKGLENIKKFNWRTTALKVIEALNENI